MTELEEYLNKFDNTEKINNNVYAELTEKTNATEYLLTHRKHIEDHKLGYGDRAFHYMWSLLLSDLFNKHTKPRILEIGVFKGQVISLWSLISQREQKSLEIHAISPFEGNFVSKNGMFQKIINKFNPVYKRERRDGNLYEKEDYLQIINGVFERFGLPFEEVKKYQGYSTDPSIVAQFNKEYLDLVYIDGDHSYDGCKSDIVNYSPKIKKGGYLVMDDASCNIPGGGEGSFWKGHQSVSDACEIIPEMGFENILNVGHNRIYRKNES